MQHRKLAPHDAELVEIDAEHLYAEFIAAEGAEAASWPTWAEMDDNARATWRFAATHPYCND